MEVGELELQEAVQELYKSGAYSDLTVICGDRRFNVHKAVVCMRCPWFALACKERWWKEGAENVIILEAGLSGGCEDVEKDDPRAVQCMFDFLYLNTYGTTSTYYDQTCYREFDFVLHAKVYALGRKYNLPALKKAALENFKKGPTWISSTSNFLPAVRTVFSTTPDSDTELREAVTEFIYTWPLNFESPDELDDAIQSMGGLGYRLWKRSYATKGPVCPICKCAYVERCLECIDDNESEELIEENFFVSCQCFGGQKYCCAHRDTV